MVIRPYILKPVELLKEMIVNSSEPGELIVDFFAGSGVAEEAAIMTSRSWTAFEIDCYWYEVIKQRIQNTIESKKKLTLST
jgi:site-specific DNA-methyltransferase (adenine-specific)